MFVLRGFGRDVTCEEMRKSLSDRWMSWKKIDKDKQPYEIKTLSIYSCVLLLQKFSLFKILTYFS